MARMSFLELWLPLTPHGAVSGGEVWDLSQRCPEGLCMMQVDSLCGVGRQRVYGFRSDCGPAAFSAEHMVGFAQRDKELGRSSGCWSEWKPLPFESICLPCPEPTKVMLPQLSSHQPHRLSSQDILWMSTFASQVPERCSYGSRSAVGMPVSPLSDCFSSLTFLPSSLEDSLLGEGPVERPGARLCLSDGPLRTAVKRRYGKRLALDKTAHVVIAGDCSPDQHGRDLEVRAARWPLCQG